MKRALQRQREEARQEAEKLIQALQEEEELEESEKEEREEERKTESEETKKIREALTGGVVRRAKHGSKSLEVKDEITIQPLFETPEVPSLFEESDGKSGEKVGSRLVEELEEESEDAEDGALLGDRGENPWLVEGGGEKSGENEEDEVDVEATVANLEVGVNGLTMS